MGKSTSNLKSDRLFVNRDGAPTHDAIPRVQLQSVNIIVIGLSGVWSMINASVIFPS